MISEKDIEFIGNISLEDLDIFQKNLLWPKKSYSHPQ